LAKLNPLLIDTHPTRPDNHRMKHIAVLTSGGDSPGMNAAVRSVVRCGIASGLRVSAVRRGYEGLLEGRFDEMSTRDVSGLISAGGSAIGSARCPEMFEPAGPEQAAKILKRRDVDGLVVIGGDGSYRGALEISKHGMAVVGLPGTIDNDIPGTERTIGFDTACNTLLHVLNQLRDTAASHHRTFVVEAMGRSAGWLALYAGISGGADIIIVPEIPWSNENVLQRLSQRVEQGKTFHLIVIAEGAGRATDLAGWLNEATPGELEIRVCIPGHIQRGGAPTVADRLFATECGRQAVQALAAGRCNVMVGEQAGRIAEVPLEEALTGRRLIGQELYDLAVAVG
jgi:6-phosphofructokinase 1